MRYFYLVSTWEALARAAYNFTEMKRCLRKRVGEHNFHEPGEWSYADKATIDPGVHAGIASTEGV